MGENSSLWENSAVGVTAVILIISTIIALYQIYVFGKNLKYKSAQIPCMILFTTPIIVGWSAWVTLLVGEELKNLNSLVTVDKAICLLFFMIFTENLIGWTHVNGRNKYTKEKVVANLLTMKEAK